MTRTRRVLIVGPSLRYLGGQAVQAGRLLHGLRGAEGIKAQYLEVDPVLPMPLALLQRVPILRTLVTSLRYMAALLRQVPRHDTIHIFSASYWSFLIAPTPALIVGRLFGKRVLLNYHSGEADDHLTRWGWHAIPLLRLADVIVVPTGFLVDVFHKHGLAATPIPNHIDADGLPRRSRASMVPRFFCNRNFEAHYSVRAVVAAFREVQAVYPTAELVLAGGGALRNALEEQAGELGLARVTFTGPVLPSSMPALYDAADVYVNASLIDNMPLSLLEAYVHGVPVVTSDAGGIPWIARDGDTAAVVPAGDVTALAAAMIAVVREPAQAQERARRARMFVQAQFAWDRVRGQWLDVYAGTSGPVTSRVQSA
jgi:glycosyltransferase involved in cell wall biosynthesis